MSIISIQLRLSGQNELKRASFFSVSYYYTTPSRIDLTNALYVCVGGDLAYLLLLMPDCIEILNIHFDLINIRCYRRTRHWNLTLNANGLSHKGD